MREREVDGIVGGIVAEGMGTVGFGDIFWD